MRDKSFRNKNLKGESIETGNTKSKYIHEQLYQKIVTKMDIFTIMFSFSSTTGLGSPNSNGNAPQSSVSVPHGSVAPGSNLSTPTR